MASQDNVKTEKRYKKILDEKAPPKPNKIKISGFQFKKPNYWDDQLVLTRIVRALKLVCSIAVLIVLGINLSVIVVNDKKMNWDLFTYDHSGEIRWTRAQKIQ